MVLQDETLPHHKGRGLKIGSTIRDGFNRATADDAARLALEGNFESDVVQLQFKEPNNLYDMVKHTATANTLEALKGVRVEARAVHHVHKRPMVNHVSGE